MFDSYTLLYGLTIQQLSSGWLVFALIICAKPMDSFHEIRHQNDVDEAPTELSNLFHLRFVYEGS